MSSSAAPAPGSLRVLLIGNGGREHALAWKLLQSPLVGHLDICPGNGGTAVLAASHPERVNNLTTLSPTDFPSLAAFARDNGINLLVPGPEQPLVDGITDYFTQHVGASVRIFGPSAAAAQLEGSKAFSKEFMDRHAIPTAAYSTFVDHDAAVAYLNSVWASHRVVIKASGLAAGKGVIIPTTLDEARAALREMMVAKEFGAAGDEVVIEEYLEGDECSIISFVDGETIKSLPAAQDHKRVGDGDTGGNTGGMGTYAPAGVVTPELWETIHTTALKPTVAAMKADGTPFKGILFTGFMLTSNGPKVLEYNVRFGDPETQSLLPLLETDLAELMIACADGRLADVDLKIANKSAATVVVAAGGYPGSYAKGTPMKLESLPADVILFHAGTSLKSDNALVTSGGRVIAATAVAPTLREAVDKAYEGVKCISFDGMHFRRDIAGRALR